MTAFVIIATMFSIAAIALLTWPLFRSSRNSGTASESINIAIYRDQLEELKSDMAAGSLSKQDFEKARDELESRMLEDIDSGVAVPLPVPVRSQNCRRVAWVLIIGLPICAAVLYLIVGRPEALSPQSVLSATDSSHGTEASLEQMVAGLAARLQVDPSNGEGWMMLARSYSTMGRHAEAAAAYKNAATKLPPDAQLMADYADALAMAQGRQLAGEPEKLIARALEIDGNNLKALALAGTVAFDKRDYTGAIKYWGRMRMLVQKDSDEARSIDSNIAEARSLGGKGGNASLPTVPEPNPAPVTELSSKPVVVSGVVTLAPELQSKVLPTDMVYIFARAASGPPMPLAVLRKRVSDLPVTFRLDDGMAMLPTMKLSNYPQVVVGARISKTANATPQPGDFQGINPPVNNNAEGQIVVINKEIR
jgi:cytochrome c-type biogenesis protein CcmH